MSYGLTGQTYVLLWAAPKYARAAKTLKKTRLDNNLNTVVRSMYGSMIEFRGEVKNDIKSLREDLNALNDSVSNLSMCLQEHKKQTETELANKLDSLTATTAQLYSDLQQIQDNISDVECLCKKQSLDLHQNMQDNFTHQLKKIQDHIEQLSVHTCGSRDRKMETCCLPGHD